MNEEAKKLNRLWRSVLISIVNLEKRWKAFQEATFTMPRDVVAELPIEAQKAIAKWGRSEFHKAGPNMIEHLWATGGYKEHLNQLRIQTEELKPKEDNEDGIT